MWNAKDVMQQGRNLRKMAQAGAGRIARIALLGLSLGAAAPVLAQSDQFTPAVTVNGTVITRYEINQRREFLRALNQQGDQEQMALEGLISDRLQMDAARKLGVTVSDADIQGGMDEFAARGNLPTEGFVKAIAQNGVEPQTFRDFVRAGLMWREVLRARFVGTIHISEAQVDRALASGAASGGKLQVLLSEIVLPADDKNDRNLIVQRIQAKVKSADDFAFQARLYSKVGTAKAGGTLGWLDRDALPPAVTQALTKLKPGEMTGPIMQQGAITLYFLRDISQVAGDPKGAPMVDYAWLQPGGGLDLARLQKGVTSCDDLYVAARGLPVTALQRQTVPEATLPTALRGAVAGLDAGESALVAAANGTPALVMLCSRIPQSQVPPSRDNVRSELINQKVNLLAQAYMEELRSEAIIVQQ